jgi:hypothetical protein
MRKNKYAILCGAAVAAMPLVSKAVTITYTWDWNDISYSTSSTGNYTLASSGPAGTLTGTTANTTLEIPSGDFFKIGLDVNVGGDTYPGDAFGGAPETLGVASWQVGLAASNKAVGSVVPLNQTVGVTVSNIVLNPVFLSTHNPGLTDGNGGVNAAQGTIGANSFGGSQYSTSMSYGGGAPAELYNSLRAKANGSTGQTSTFTLTNNASAFQYVVLNSAAFNSGGSTPVNVPATFKNQTYNGATDSFSAMPVLNLVIGTPNTGGGTSSNKIISLVTTQSAVQGTAPNGYGANPLATLPVSPLGQTTSVTFAATPTGYVAVTGGPSPFYALKILVNGNTATTSAIAAIVNDITGSEAGVGSAVAVAGSAYAGVFPGYDILVPDSLSNASPYFAFDFTSPTDGDSSIGAVTVTSVAAVPEPATMAGVILGAAGLLLGRRKNRTLVA